MTRPQAVSLRRKNNAAPQQSEVRSNCKKKLFEWFVLCVTSVFLGKADVGIKAVSF